MEQITLSCPHCGFSKEIEQTRIPAGTNNIRCPKCKQSFSFENSFTFEPAPVEPLISQPSAAAEVGANQVRASADLPVEGSAESKICPTCGKKIHIRAEICPGCGVRVAPPATAVSKLALLLITFFLGGIGGHRFYQKKYWLGALYLVFFWTYIPSLVAFVEFILYAFKSEAELQRRYPVASSRAIVFAVIIPMVGIALIGILAAIAIPQFVSYRQKAYNAAAKSDLKACQAQAEAYFADKMIYPVQGDQLQCQVSKEVALYYLSMGRDEFQIISFHGNGNKAFLAKNATEMEENTRGEIESQIREHFGASALDRSFHFIE